VCELVGRLRQEDQTQTHRCTPDVQTDGSNTDQRHAHQSLRSWTEVSFRLPKRTLLFVFHTFVFHKVV